MRPTRRIELRALRRGERLVKGPSVEYLLDYHRRCRNHRTHSKNLIMGDAFNGVGLRSAERKSVGTEVGMGVLRSALMARRACNSPDGQPSTDDGNHKNGDDHGQYDSDNGAGEGEGLRAGCTYSFVPVRDGREHTDGGGPHKREHDRAAGQGHGYDELCNEIDQEQGERAIKPGPHAELEELFLGIGEPTEPPRKQAG